MNLGPLFGEVSVDASTLLDQAERQGLAALLNAYPADRVKRMAQRWFGKATKTRKQDCIDQMAEALGQPAVLHGIYERLSPFEKSGLWMLVQRGGVLPVLELAADLLAAGHEFQDVGNYFSYYSYGYSSSEFFRVASSLADTGLLINTSVDTWNNTLDPSPFARQTAALGVSTYARLVPHLEPVAPRPLDLAPLVEPLKGEFLRPAQAAIPLGAVTEILRGVETIALSARGGFPRPFVNRTAKHLGVEASRDASAPLPDPALFYLQLAVSARFLSFPAPDRTTSLAPLAGKLMAQPYEVQAASWVNGYRSLKGWAEPLPARVYFHDENLCQANKLNAFRSLVVTALSALPQPEAWYAAGAFSDTLHARTRGYLPLVYRREFYPDYRTTPAQQREARQAYHEQQLVVWREVEQVLIENILRGPLYHLGIVEIASAAEGALAFRLTDLGRAVLHGIPMPGANEEVGAAGSWVVQPNLEIVAYLDRTQPAGLALLSRIAERKSSTGPVAVYAVTRESIYAALESGFTGEEIVEALRQGTAHDVPDTVMRSIRDWSARRERIQLHPSTTLLQYADAAARDAALPNLARSAIAVGDRFIILPDGDLQGVHGRKVAQRIDYAAAPLRCVTAEEDGALRIDPQRSDLLVASELSAFADASPEGEGLWKLNRASVQRAAVAGHTADTILKALSIRAASPPIPPILAAAIPRWARKIGQPAPPSLETVLVLELPSEEIANAVAASRRFQPLLKSRLGPRAFSVAAKDEDQVRQLLAEYALEPPAAPETTGNPEALTPSARRSRAR